MPIATSTTSTLGAAPARQTPRPRRSRLIAGRGAARAGDDRLRRPVGVAGLAGVVGSCALLAAGSASKPGVYLPGAQGVWPAFMGSPLQAIGLHLPAGRFQAITLLLIGSYALVLYAGERISWRLLWLSILAAHAALLLGAPLLSRDLVGYLSFARLGVLHGLSPYAHSAAEAPGDPLYALAGWPHQHTPYGPLFTVISYAFAPLGLRGGLWGLRALSVLSSLAAIWLLAKSAPARGRDGVRTAAFVGLNPALLELAVGGFHNDTLLLAALALALLALTARRPRYGSGIAAIVAAFALKIAGGLALPFLLASPAPGGRRLERSFRIRMLGVAAASLLLLIACTWAAFGSGALGLLTAINSEQLIVSPHSLPAELAALFGIAGTPAWWRALFAGGFLAAAAIMLWRAARGYDWLDAAGWTTLALLLASAWLLPWYAVWLLPFAALARSRALRGATLLFCLYALSFHLPATAALLGGPSAAPPAAAGTLLPAVR